jgi:hypothetical protein
MHRLPIPQLRVQPVEFLQQKAQLLRPDPRQPVVVEAEINRPLRRQLGPQLILQLVQVRRLARAPHPDHRMHLPRHRWQARVATRQRPRRDGPECGLQFFRQNRMKRHGSSVAHMCP